MANRPLKRAVLSLNLSHLLQLYAFLCILNKEHEIEERGPPLSIAVDQV